MALLISDSQMAHLAAAMRQRTLADLLAVAERMVPDAVAGLDRKAALACADAAVEAAIQYGIQQDDGAGLALYLMFALTFGAGFESIPAFAPVLSDLSLPPGDRLRQLLRWGTIKDWSAIPRRHSPANRLR
jgi:hypothetical protein